MDTAKFQQVYGLSRNGAEFFVRHPLVRSFAVSDGVRDLADVGCWWLIDIAATELPAVLGRKSEYMGVLTATVKNGKAKLEMTGTNDVTLWDRDIDYTDMPEGKWNFYVTLEDGSSSLMILPTEY